MIKVKNILKKSVIKTVDNGEVIPKFKVGEFIENIKFGVICKVTNIIKYKLDNEGEALCYFLQDYKNKAFVKAVQERAKAGYSNVEELLDKEKGRKRIKKVSAIDAYYIKSPAGEIFYGEGNNK